VDTTTGSILTQGKEMFAAAVNGTAIYTLKTAVNVMALWRGKILRINHIVAEIVITFGVRQTIRQMELGKYKFMQDPTHIAIPRVYFWKETDAAYCFRLEDGDNSRFVNLPKSRIRDYQEIEGKCDFWIEGWLIEKNEIEEFIDSSYAPSLFEL